MRLIIVVLLFCMLIVSGCSEKKEDQNMVVNMEKEKGINEVYTSQRLEVPYDRNTTELDYIAEQCIGIITNKEGRIEMFTVTRSVKEHFREEADKLIEQQKQLRADMLECRVWKFFLDEEKNWHREAVCDSSLIDEAEIADLNTKVVKFVPSYNREGNFVVFMQYSFDQNGGSAYGIRVYELEEKKWKALGEYTYEESDGNLQEPVNVCMASEEELLVARMDGTLVKYNFSLEEETDEGTEFSGDISFGAFSNEYGFGKSDSENKIMVFDIDDFVEEKQLTIPEKDVTGSEAMGVNSKDVIYYANALGVYRENEEATLEKICSTDIVSGVTVENMVFNYMGVSDDGDVVIHMYDPMDENTPEYIYLLKSKK